MPYIFALVLRSELQFLHSYLPHAADDAARHKHVFHDVLLLVPQSVMGKGREGRKAEILHALSWKENRRIDHLAGLIPALASSRREACLATIILRRILTSQLH